MSTAPGAPGLAPSWCSSAKEMVGCSLGSSRLWFTIGGGIINEVYYPRIDLPQIRDLGAPLAGMIPEQVWDAAPIPARGLSPGRPTGSAMPLVWAHAEYLKLVASRSLGRPFDRPNSVWERYRGERPRLTRVIWCEQAPATQLPEGATLIACLREAGAVRFGLDGWQEVREEGTTANSLGLHVVEIDTSRLAAGRRIDLTYRAGSNWIGRDFRVLVTPASPAS